MAAAAVPTATAARESWCDREQKGRTDETRRTPSKQTSHDHASLLYSETYASRRTLPGICALR
jgi:hypothetical protein